MYFLRVWRVGCQLPFHGSVRPGPTPFKRHHIDAELCAQELHDLIAFGVNDKVRFAVLLRFLQIDYDDLARAALLFTRERELFARVHLQ